MSNSDKSATQELAIVVAIIVAILAFAMLSFYGICNGGKL